MAKILIAGDSWGEGIWFPSRPASVEGSFAHILEQNKHNVTNLSKGGFSNFDSFSSLFVEFLNNGPHCRVIWIQTDPMRDFRIKGESILINETIVPKYDFNPLRSYYINKSRSLEQFLTSHLDATYCYLNRLADQYECKIYCIGGCSALSKSISSYRNLIPLLPSISEFLIKGYKDNIFNNTESWMNYQLPNFLNKTMLDNVGLTDWDQCYLEYCKKLDIWRSSEYFKIPDHCHPDYEGHLAIAQYLLKKLDL